MVVMTLADALGTGTATLYGRVVALVEKTRGRRRERLSRIALDVLCGAYHDFRAGAPNPKGDLVEALEHVHEPYWLDGMLIDPPSLIDMNDVIILIADVLRGEFSDGPAESARWAESVAADLKARMPGEPSIPDPAAIELTPREREAFVWLYRYVEVHGQPPTVKEIASGIGRPAIEVNEILRQCLRKGAVVRIGGSRGWLPVRAP